MVPPTKFYCRKAGDPNVTAGQLYLPTDWKNRPDGPLIVTDDDERGGALAFQLVCGDKRYDLEKFTTAEGAATLKVSGRPDNEMVNPDADQYIYIDPKDGEFVAFANRDSFDQAVTNERKAETTKTHEGDEPWVRGGFGLGVSSALDTTPGNLPDITPNNYGVTPTQPSRERDYGVVLNGTVDILPPLHNGDGTRSSYGYIPLFLTADLYYQDWGRAGEDRQGFAGASGALRSVFGGVGVGLSTKRIAWAVPGFEKIARWWPDLYIKTDLVGFRNVQMKTNYPGEAPAEKTSFTEFTNIKDAPNFRIGLNLPLGKIGGVMAGIDVSYTLLNQLALGGVDTKTHEGRSGLWTHNFLASIHFYLPEKYETASADDLAFDGERDPVYTIPVAEPEPQRVIVAAAPPAPPKFEKIDPPAKVRRTASAEVTFISGSSEVQQHTMADIKAISDAAGPKDKITIRTEDESTADLKVNAKVYATANNIQAYIDYLKTVGLEGDSYTMTVGAYADVRGSSAANLKLSSERADNFFAALDVELKRRGLNLNIEKEVVGYGESKPVGVKCAKKDCIDEAAKVAARELGLAAIDGGSKNLIERAPYYGADGKRIKGDYSTEDVKNGGYGTLAVTKKVNKKTVTEYYLINFRAARRVETTIEANTLPTFDTVKPAPTPAIETENVGTAVSVQKLTLTGMGGLQEAGSPLTEPDLMNFAGAVKAVKDSGAKLMMLVSQKEGRDPARATAIENWLSLAAKKFYGQEVKMRRFNSEELKGRGITINEDGILLMTLDPSKGDANMSDIQSKALEMVK